jgi:hypothetical protein
MRNVPVHIALLQYGRRKRRLIRRTVEMLSFHAEGCPKIVFYIPFHRILTFHKVSAIKLQVGSINSCVLISIDFIQVF